MRCATHPDVETNLRCGKCGKLICPKCMVQTPVGARCKQCARLYKLPTYRVPAAYYLRAIGAALGMAIVCGIIWGVIESFLFAYFFGLFSLILAAGIFVDAYVVITLTLAQELKGVETSYSGASLGMVLTFAEFGNFIFPSLGIGLAEIDSGLPLVFWAFISLLALVIIIFTRIITRGH